MLKSKFGVSDIPEELKDRITSTTQKIKELDPTSQNHVNLQTVNLFYSKDEVLPRNIKREEVDVFEDDYEDDVETLMKTIKDEVRIDRNNRLKSEKQTRMPIFSDDSEDDLERTLARKANTNKRNSKVRLAQKEESEGMILLRKYALKCKFGYSLL